MHLPIEGHGVGELQSALSVRIASDVKGAYSLSRSGRSTFFDPSTATITFSTDTYTPSQTGPVGHDARTHSIYNPFNRIILLVLGLLLALAFRA